MLLPRRARLGHDPIAWHGRLLPLRPSGAERAGGEVGHARTGIPHHARTGIPHLVSHRSAGMAMMAMAVAGGRPAPPWS